MSQDLLTQLAEYGAYCEERQGSVAADDVFGDVVLLPELAQRVRPRRWVWAGAAAVIASLLIGSVAWLVGGNSDQDVIEGTVATIHDPPAGSNWRGHWGGGFVETGNAVWLRTHDDGQWSVVRVDKASGEVERIQMEGQPGKMLAAPDALWVNVTYETGAHAVARIDLVSRTVTNAIDVPVRGDLISVDGGLWVIIAGTGSIRIDLATLTTETVSPGARDGQAMWIGEVDGGLWSSSGDGAGLVRIDLDTREVEQYRLPGTSSDFGPFILAGDGIWLQGEAGLHRFDLESQEVTDTVAGVEGVDDGAFADGAVWVINHRMGTVTRINAATAEVTDVIPVSGSPRKLFVADNSLWVADEDRTLSRIDIATHQVTDVIAIGSLEYLLVADGAIWSAADNGTITSTVIDPAP